MRLSRIGSKTQRRFRSDQAASDAIRTRVEVEKVKEVVGTRGVTIRKDESGIARGGFIQEANRFKKRFLRVLSIELAFD